MDIVILTDIKEETIIGLVSFKEQEDITDNVKILIQERYSTDLVCIDTITAKKELFNGDGITFAAEINTIDQKFIDYFKLKTAL